MTLIPDNCESWDKVCPVSLSSGRQQCQLKENHLVPSGRLDQRVGFVEDPRDRRRVSQWDLSGPSAVEIKRPISLCLFSTDLSDKVSLNHCPSLLEVPKTFSFSSVRWALVASDRSPLPLTLHGWESSWAFLSFGSTFRVRSLLLAFSTAMRNRTGRDETGAHFRVVARNQQRLSIRDYWSRSSRPSAHDRIKVAASAVPAALRLPSCRVKVGVCRQMALVSSSLFVLQLTLLPGCSVFFKVFYFAASRAPIKFNHGHHRLFTLKHLSSQPFASSLFVASPFTTPHTLLTPRTRLSRFHETNHPCRVCCTHFFILFLKNAISLN